MTLNIYNTEFIGRRRRMSQKKGKGLMMEQDVSKLPLDPFSHQIISRQATIDIGMIGHVAQENSTLVRAISGVQNVCYKNELERNITNKLALGYANAKIYKCEDERCPTPLCYKGYASGKEDNPMCDVPGFEDCRMKLIRHVSFVHCPGHDTLIARMLGGPAFMDGALFLIAANESFPQPQTSEFLAAIEVMRLKNILIIQTNADLVQPSVAIKQQQDIKNFIKGTVAEGAPLIPISAQFKCSNMDSVCEYIVNKIPKPVRDFISPPRMTIIRSFHGNNEQVDDNIRGVGGVAGGNILKGVLKLNQYIEVRPGIIVMDENGNFKCTPIYTRVVSLFAEQNELQFAVPGGLIGVGTTMDPTLTRCDRLVGHVLGEVGSLPEIYHQLEVRFTLLSQLIGLNTRGAEEERARVSKLSRGEILMLNIGSMSVAAHVVAVSTAFAKLKLTSPVCTTIGEKFAISRRIRNWRLIGLGQILAGTNTNLDDVPPCPI